MSSPCHAGPRSLEDRFDTRRRDELIEHYPGAQFIVRVRATHVFPNCQ
jgi:hypothetical protein